MKIAFSFHGKLYGETVKSGVTHVKDFRHCWPNLKTKLIDPFIEQGHEAVVYISSYEIDDPVIKNEFFDIVKPERVVYSSEEGSSPLTCKFAAFENFVDDVDFIVYTRNDVHFNRIMANENIDFDKFNFIFPEGRRDGFWWTQRRFVCDMVMMWPHRLTPIVKQAMMEMKEWPRAGHIDTHGFWLKLIQYLPDSEIHFISQYPEPSDVNSFFTTCRSELPREPLINSEIWQKYYASDPVVYRDIWGNPI